VARRVSVVAQFASVNMLAFRPVTAVTLADFESFFASPGAPKYCWCMVWRRTSGEAKHRESADRRRQMLKRIRAGVPVGLLAYDDGSPVAWVSVAPRETYRNLGGPAAEPGERVWSIVCFFVPRRHRGAGLIRRLIAAAVDHARGEGATAVEAYPVDADAPSYRYMGFVRTFAANGFVELGMAGKRRHVMRLALGRG
jgi:GNAT superfamily N-acetyltransferase